MAKAPDPIKQKEQETKVRREKLINDQIQVHVNQNPGQRQSVYWIRTGPYGKDDTVLARWTDQTSTCHIADLTERNYPLAMFNNREEAVKTMLMLNTGLTFVVFCRTFTPQWSIETKEVVLVTDKISR